MAARLLQLDDLRYTGSPEKIASLFQKLGYNAAAHQLAIEDLELSERSTEALWDAYLIASQGQGALQVLLFQLQEQEFRTPSIASSRMKAIASIKVLDPAVGSGAFPLGMMQVILNVRQAIARREGMKVSRGSLTISQWKRDIIANNLYGVDIKPEAIEIAKLRMWLSLVVDIPNIEDVEPLPNLDYKLMCGDSLISTIHGEQLIPDPTKTQQTMLAVTPIQQAIQPLLDLEHRYFDAQTEERHQLREQILAAEANVFRVAVSDRQSYWLGKQRELERQIQAMKGKASRAMDKERKEIADKLAELAKFAAEVEGGERSLNFFQYHLHFRDVFESKGGFDVVIGNPPYVRQEKQDKEHKEQLKDEFPELFNGRSGIYSYFYGLGIKLLRHKGLIAYICQNTWLRAGYGANLRKYLDQSCEIYHLIDFGVLPVFDAAVLTMIFIASKQTNIQENSPIFTQVKSLEPPYPDVDAITKQQGITLPRNSIKQDEWHLIKAQFSSIFNKINNTESFPLNQYVNGQIFWGVKTGYNQAFFIDETIKNKLISENHHSIEVIKPLIIGDDVRKWFIKEKNQYLIYMYREINIDKISNIIDFLSQYKIELEKRATKQNWYELQQPQYEYSLHFYKPKIMYPEIAHSSRFTIDYSGAFTNNKCFCIPSNDLYLLGILNSSPVWIFLKSICSALLGDVEKGGGIELRTIYMKKIPIPTALEPDRLAIEALVQKCLDAQGVGVEEWEAEIDDRVAYLYGLTAEEMKIIRGE